MLSLKINFLYLPVLKIEDNDQKKFKIYILTDRGKKISLSFFIGILRMTLVSHIPFSELASSELAFNFLPSSTIENLESENENIRLSTIRNLIATVRTTPPSHINVEQFTNYMLKFLDDEFIQISQLTCSVIESLCINLSGNMTIYKNFFMKIAIRFLGSDSVSLLLFPIFKTSTSLLVV